MAKSKSDNLFGVTYMTPDLDAGVVRVEVALTGGRPGSSAAKAGKLPGWTVAVGRQNVPDGTGETTVQVVAYRAPRTRAELDACMHALQAALAANMPVDTEAGA